MGGAQLTPDQDQRGPEGPHSGLTHDPRSGRELFVHWRAAEPCTKEEKSGRYVFALRPSQQTTIGGARFGADFLHPSVKGISQKPFRRRIARRAWPHCREDDGRGSRSDSPRVSRSVQLDGHGVLAFRSMSKNSISRMYDLKRKEKPVFD